MMALSGILIALVMLGVGGCAGGVGPLTVAPTVNIAGTSVGSWATTNPTLNGGTIEMTVTQTRPRNAGALLVTDAPTHPSGPTEGIVSGNEVRVQRPRNVTGGLTVQGDTMQGNVGSVIDVNATVTRQK